MPEYHLEFGETLAEVAMKIIDEGIDPIDTQRTILYLSLLSAEISLKSMLEKAGKPVKEIRKSSHRLESLLNDLSHCEVEVEVVPGHRMYVSASRLRSCTIHFGEGTTTVGEVISAESHGASTYPNKVRYGDVLKHFPATVVAQMAVEICNFARQHWDSIRIA